MLTFTRRPKSDPSPDPEPHPNPTWSAAAQLRLLLERLDAFTHDSVPINVNNLMALAAAEKSNNAKALSSQPAHH